MVCTYRGVGMDGELLEGGRVHLVECKYEGERGEGMESLLGCRDERGRARWAAIT